MILNARTKIFHSQPEKANEEKMMKEGAQTAKELDETRSSLATQKAELRAQIKSNDDRIEGEVK